MSDININKVVLKKEGNRYIFDPKGNIDLSNYYTKEETDSKYALASHTHSIANITNLQSTLDGKSNTNHTHSNYATQAYVNSQISNNTASNVMSTRNSSYKVLSRGTFNQTYTATGLGIFISGKRSESHATDIYINGSKANSFSSAGAASEVYSSILFQKGDSVRIYMTNSNTQAATYIWVQGLIL